MADNPATPGYSAAVVMLPVTNVPRSSAFYQQVGLRVGNTFTPEGSSEPVWAWLHSGQAALMIARAPQPVAGTHDGASLWLYAVDVKEAHALLKSRGLDVGEIEYPFYNPAGEFHVHDPDGYAVFIAQAD